MVINGEISWADRLLMNTPLRQNKLLPAYLSGVLLTVVYLLGTGLHAELEQFENLMQVVGGWLFIALVVFAVSKDLIPLLHHYCPFQVDGKTHFSRFIPQSITPNLCPC